MRKLLRRREVIAGVLGIALLSVWARLTILPQVFVAGTVLPAFPDVHYHLRRIRQTLEGFPHVPVFDPHLNWPDGGPCPWPPGFDWLGAVFVALLGGASDPGRAAHVAAFFPVFLGLGVVAVTVCVARALTPRDPSGDAQVWAAGALAAVWPQAVVVSRVGSVDHHVAEALSMSLLGAWVLWAARDPDRPRASWIRFELVGGAIAVFAGTVFNGSILYVAIACGLMIALRLGTPPANGPVSPYATRRERSGPGPWFGSGAAAMVVAAAGLELVNQALVAEHGRAWDFRFPSHLQPLLHAVAALGCALAALASRTFTERRVFAERFALRACVFLGACFAVAAVGALAVPGAARELVGGLTQWLLRSDPWLAGINEFQPLFPTLALWRPDAYARLFELHGALGLLALVTVPVGLRVAFRRDRAVGACFAGWTLALVGLTLLQTRFGRVSTPNLAVVTALSIGVALSTLSTWLSSLRSVGSRSGLREPLGVLSVLALLAACDPTIRAELAWQAPRPPSALEAASLYLRSLPADERTGGVLTKWDYGHTVLAVADRPVVAAGFGPWPGERGFDEVRAVMERDEGELMALMERRDLHYIVAGLYSFLPSAHTASPDDAPAFLVDRASGRVEANPSFFRAKPLSSLVLGGSGQPGIDVRHATHLMPRFVSEQRIDGLSIPVFQFWVYERVPGAVIRGRARPGARVVARTQLRVHGELYPYAAWADAADDGSFEIVVPLPSDLHGDGVETAPYYQVVDGDEVVGRVALREEMVREGRTVDL